MAFKNLKAAARAYNKANKACHDFSATSDAAESALTNKYDKMLDVIYKRWDKASVVLSKKLNAESKRLDKALEVAEKAVEYFENK